MGGTPSTVKIRLVGRSWRDAGECQKGLLDEPDGRRTVHRTRAFLSSEIWPAW
jgi:hypothetical protein